MSAGIVSTTNGPIRGELRDGLAVFRGVRYAAPPVGELRFKPSMRPAPWTEPADCTQFGPVPPQVNHPLADAGPGGPPQSEDCLSLNLWTPACDDARRPVLFWLHGGGYTIGAGSSEGYDGTAFATRHDVVIVTINYRLGALGFADLSALGEAYAKSGNSGLLDQLLALEWVRDNIAGFGGDPGNVTIFGESAGAGSVASLMAMPVASKLFHKAIAQSGAHGLVRNLETAKDTTRLLCEALGGTEADILVAPLDKLLAAQAATAAQRPELASLPFAPVVDGVVLPPVLDRIASGSAPGVPLLIGSNLNEGHLYKLFNPSWQTLDRAGMISRLEPLLGDGATAVVDSYLTGRPNAEASDIWSAIMTDRVFRAPAARMAEQQSKHAPCFMYLFAWQTPAMGGRLGACHGLEVPFAFGNLRESVFTPAPTPEMQAISDWMLASWAAFAHTGDPNHAGALDWPVYDSARRATMVFDTQSAVAFDPAGEELALWP